MKKSLGILLAVLMLTSCAASNGQEEMIEYFEYSVPKSRLSEETIEWLENFNALPYSSKIAVSYIPGDLADLITEIKMNEGK